MSAELHNKILTFLAGEFVKTEGHQCVSVELVYSPGGGYKEEPIREWVRQDDPDAFELNRIPDFVTRILDIAEGEVDAKSAGKHRFVVRTKQYLGQRMICSFPLQPAYNGVDETAMVATGHGGGGGGRSSDAQVISQHANALMRNNTQMFDGTIRVLCATNDRLSKENGDLRAENLILRREVEEARTNKLDKEFQIAMAADKNARANQGFKQFMQLLQVAAAKIGGSQVADMLASGGAGAGALPPGFQALLNLLTQFKTSLREDQAQTLFMTLDMTQKATLAEAFQIVEAIQKAQEQHQQQQAGGSQQANGAAPSPGA